MLPMYGDGWSSRLKRGIGKEDRKSRIKIEDGIVKEITLIHNITSLACTKMGG